MQTTIQRLLMIVTGLIISHIGHSDLSNLQGTIWFMGSFLVPNRD